MDMLEQIGKWHDNDEHRKIIAAIEALPPRERGFELTSLLGRAYNNVGRFNDALTVLRSVEEAGRNDQLWNFRMGFAYFYRPHLLKSAKRDFETAARFFAEAIRCGDSDPDTVELIQNCKELTARIDEDPDVILEYGGLTLRSCCLK